MYQQTEEDLGRDKFSDWRPNWKWNHKQAAEWKWSWWERERFSRVWLLRADKLTMVETQSDQFLSHRTSAYIISLLSPPRPSAPAPLIYTSQPECFIYTGQDCKRLQRIPPALHHLESSCRSCRGKPKQSRRCLNMFHVSQNLLKMLQNNNDRPTEAVMVQSRSI